MCAVTYYVKEYDYHYYQYQFSRIHIYYYTYYSYMEQSFSCYLITSGNHTYIGYSNDPYKRLNQHNGLIKGGAKATRVAKNWSIHTIVTLNNKSDALKFEWLWKHTLKNNKWIRTPSGIHNKIDRLNEIINDFNSVTAIVSPTYPPMDN